MGCFVASEILSIWAKGARVVNEACWVVHGLLPAAYSSLRHSNLKPAAQLAAASPDTLPTAPGLAVAQSTPPYTFFLSVWMN